MRAMRRGSAALMVLAVPCALALPGRPQLKLTPEERKASVEIEGCGVGGCKQENEQGGQVTIIDDHFGDDVGGPSPPPPPQKYFEGVPVPQGWHEESVPADDPAQWKSQQ